MTFWDTDTWHEYERLCGDEPGTRSRTLAASDWQTRVVDLSASEAELWREVRRSYHALIHKTERECEIDVDLDGAVSCAQQIHAEVSGRKTRPAETWRMMESWVWEDKALIVSVRQDQSNDIDGVYVIHSKMLGYTYIVIHGLWAYYHSASTLKDNLNHALLWHAMTALKSHGVRYLELGWQGEAHDAKGKAIEWFKTGFGGYDIPAKEGPALCLA